MKFIKYGLAIMLSVLFSLSVLAHDPKENPFLYQEKLRQLNLLMAGEL